MSDFRAIATVTATLQRVLQTALQADVPGATVSTVRPGEGANTNLPTTGVNLFLFEVCVNPHRSNEHLPTRNAAGTIVQRPQIALDLHYLMSFYGDELTLEPQRLLGSALAYLQSQPVLTRAQIASAIADASKPFLKSSNLADQDDLVRLNPMTLSLDELSRLWSILLQTHYVLSIPFKASTVIVERNVATSPALPVRETRLAVAPLHHPRIDRVVSAAGEGTPIVAGATIEVVGSDLAAAATRAEIDDRPVDVATAAATQVTLTLPAGLPAGPHALLLRQGADLGSADGPRWAIASNLAAFVLHPSIGRTNGLFDVAVSNVQGAGNAPRSATVTVRVTPDVGTRQTPTLELLTGSSVARTFAALPLSAPGGQLVFPVSGIAAGDYVCRVRIDGADSAPDLDGNGVPVAPAVTFP
jgi:Pvc16 N-terminal domain